MSNIPSGLTYIQIESAEFRRPVSEGLIQAIGASINGLIDYKTATDSRLNTDESNISTLTTRLNALVANFLPVGSVMHSLLTEGQFQSIMTDAGFASGSWILADGRNVAGSIYEHLTGISTVPDMRGRFLRAKNNGTSVNPYGDLPLGSLEDYRVRDHKHSLDLSNAASSVTNIRKYQVAPLTGGVEVANFDALSNNTDTVLSPTSVNAGLETAPSSVTVNLFIRIN